MTCTPESVPPGDVNPAALHAAGFEIPAFTSAAAIFCCCVISEVLIETASGDNWITSRFGPDGALKPVGGKALWNSRSPAFSDIERESSDKENPPGPPELTASTSRTGRGLTSSPGLSASVPRMNSEFLGLIQNSSTLILLLVTIPCRARKLRTLSGAASFVVKKESQNSCWKSRCKSRSAPRGSTSIRPVLSSTKNGTCMHSPATLTHSLFLPRCFHSQTRVR